MGLESRARVPAAQDEGEAREKPRVTSSDHPHSRPLPAWAASNFPDEDSEAASPGAGGSSLLIPGNRPWAWSVEPSPRLPELPLQSSPRPGQELGRFRAPGVTEEGTGPGQVRSAETGRGRFL